MCSNKIKLYLGREVDFNKDVILFNDSDGKGAGQASSFCDGLVSDSWVDNDSDDSQTVQLMIPMIAMYVQEITHRAQIVPEHLMEVLIEICAKFVMII